MSANLFLDPATNDLALTAEKNLRFTANTGEEVSQRISVTLRTYLGEWFLNRSIGVPYFQEILGKGNDLSKVRSIFVAAISSIPGVSEILELETDFSPEVRRYSVSFVVKLATGEQVSSGVSV